MRLLGRKRYRLASAAERLREPSDHDEVGVKCDALKTAHAERGEAVVVL